MDKNVIFCIFSLFLFNSFDNYVWSSLKNPQKYLRGLSSITRVTYNPIAMTPIMMTNNGILTFFTILIYKNEKYINFLRFSNFFYT